MINRMRQLFDRHRNLFCCLFSAAASLLGFVNPLLAGVAVNRAIATLSLPGITPLIMGMAVVNGSRILLRQAVASHLRENARSPMIWMQRRIGKWLWWLEPVLHGWGLPGILLTRFGAYLKAHGLASQGLPVGRGRPKRVRRLTLSIASSLLYLLSDACVTSLAGLVYFYTRSFALSLLPAVLLPMLAAAPWLVHKGTRIHRIQKRPGKIPQTDPPR